ncbi:Histone chaperone ASF1 [Dictyocoela muelleri]|nr:Histone chaperone ASF1 [Dictyocoela muelleri]
MVLTLRSIKPDSFQKHLLEPIQLSLVLDNTHQIDDDVEFTIIYTGDPENDEHDQIVCEELVGPIPAGKVGFNLETSIVDFNKIPIDSLFGVTSIILEGKYKDQQFLRVGYFVNVSYPGETNLCHDEELGDEIDDDEYTIDETENDEYDVVSDEDLDDGDLENENEGLEEEDLEEEDLEEDDLEEDLEQDLEEEDLEEQDLEEQDLEEQEDLKNEDLKENKNLKKDARVDISITENNELKPDVSKDVITEPENPLIINKNNSVTSMVGESSYSEINREMQKNILEGPDEIEEKNKFLYDGKVLDKTKIEIELSDPPLVTVFSIKWNDYENEIIENGSEESDK